MPEVEGGLREAPQDGLDADRAAPAKVEMMRAVGVPEPLILDQLCHEFDKLIEHPRRPPRPRTRSGSGPPAPCSPSRSRPPRKPAARRRGRSTRRAGRPAARPPTGRRRSR